MNLLNLLRGKILSWVSPTSPFDREEYMREITRNEAFMLAMSKKIKACQNIEFAVFKKNKIDGKEEVMNHTLKSLFRMINKNTSFNDFLDYFLVWYEGFDNGVLLEVVEGISVEYTPDLYIHNPLNFQTYISNGQIEKIVISNPMRIITGKELQNFLWVKNPNYYDIKDSCSGNILGNGYSKHNAFAIWGAYSKKAWEWNWALANNLGKPGGIFTTEGCVDQADREEISAKYEATNSGVKNAGKPMVLGSGLKYQDASKNPIDTDWSLGEQRAYERTSLACGVPAELVGGGQSTYENRKHAKKELYKDEVIPFLNNLKQWLNFLLRNYLKEGEFIDYLLTGIDELKEDIAEIIKSLSDLKDRVTINEYRKILSDLTDIDLPAIQNGDNILVSAGDIALEDALEQIDDSNEKEGDI